MMKGQNSIVKKNQGVALLIAVIFTSVVLAFALLVGNLAYKQALIANTATGAQNAFYAADAGLECALLADQVTDSEWSTTDQTITVTCATGSKTVTAVVTADNGINYYDANIQRLDIVLGANTYCADIRIMKRQTRISDGLNAYVFSTGYDVPCAKLNASAYYTSRGLEAMY
jgi:hypothetical protein